MFNFLFRQMAKRKRKKSNLPARRSTNLSAPGRRRTKRRPKGMGEMFTPTQFINGAKVVGAGAAGGAGAMIVDKSILPSDSGKLIKLGAGAIGAFALCLFDMPNLGAGFAGGMVARAFPNGLLGEDDNANFADEDALNEPSIFLDDDGEAMMLHEDPETGAVSWRYLSEEEIAEFEENMEEEES